MGCPPGDTILLVLSSSSEVSLARDASLQTELVPFGVSLLFCRPDSLIEFLTVYRAEGRTPRVVRSLGYSGQVLQAYNDLGDTGLSAVEVCDLEGGRCDNGFPVREGE